jgi:type I restriction enzyme S subunit
MSSDLPPGWVHAPIGSLCSLVKGRAFKPTEWTTKGVPIVRIQNLNNPEAPFNHYQGALDARHRLKGGELLFAWSGTPGTSFGAHIWQGQEAALNQHIFRVDFDEGLLDKRFFRFAINEKLNELIGVAQGGVGLRHVTKGVFENTEVSVPPREEQTRIAEQLDTLLARIKACNDRLDAIPALLKRFRQAVLDAATSGDLIEEDSVPAPLVELRTVLAEPMRNGKSVRDGSGLPVLRLTSLKHSSIDLTETKTGDWSDAGNVQRFLIRNGDYLVSRGNGSRALVGRGGLVSHCDTDIAFPDTMIRIRPDRSRLLPNYLKYVWGAPLVRRQIEAAAKTTAGIWKVSQPDLEGIRIPLPLPEEQAAIVQRVQVLLDLAARIESRLAAGMRQAERLTPLTLAKAFRGELVPQDPNEEPASVLLQRRADTPAAAVKAPRGQLRTKQAHHPTPPPPVQPDWAALPAGAWAASGQPDEHATTALLIAVLKVWGQPMPQDQARLAAMLCLQPRLLTTALPAHDAVLWRRLVGAEAEPLPPSVTALQPAVNTHWRRALAGLRARGDLVASGPGPQDTWALGPGANRVDTAGWPDGRAGWVVAYLRAHGVEAILPLLPSVAVDFVHARAA